MLSDSFFLLNYFWLSQMICFFSLLKTNRNPIILFVIKRNHCCNYYFYFRVLHYNNFNEKELVNYKVTANYPFFLLSIQFPSTPSSSEIPHLFLLLVLFSQMNNFWSLACSRATISDLGAEGGGLRRETPGKVQSGLPPAVYEWMCWICLNQNY